MQSPPLPHATALVFKSSPNRIQQEVMWITKEEDSEQKNKQWMGKPSLRTMNKVRKLGVYVFFIMVIFVMVFQFTVNSKFPKAVNLATNQKNNSANQLVIVVTPTYKRFTRIPDLLRMANTLAHVKDIHWIVIEDNVETIPVVQALLERSNVPFTYMAHRTAAGYPKKGWYQRTMALDFIRSNTSQILGPDHQEGVVYFGDDDNSYDVRLFTEYIRNVKTLGIWAVGLVGGTFVEAPHCINGKVTEFDVKWHPRRKFAVDMAGFAVNLRVVLKSDAVFGTSCPRGGGAPETCLLEDMGLERDDIEPFGCEQQENREIMVWHTRSDNPVLTRVDKNNKTLVPETFGYIVEV